jgi:ABC-type Fe3+ transport system substrate-binding protein
LTISSPQIPDVVQLQTVQDFPRWKAEGALMAYKPAGWTAIHAAYRDPDATHMGIAISAFSNNVNILLVANESEWPREAADYLKPMFAGKLAITYPNDDDAVLFWFKQVSHLAGKLHCFRQSLLCLRWWTNTVGNT